MKTRFFFPTVLVILIGILTALIQSENILNKSKTNYPGIGFDPAMLHRSNSSADLKDEQVRPDLTFTPMEEQITPQKSSFFTGDSTFEILSIADPQLRSLLSGNVNAGEKQENENKENMFTNPEPVSSPVGIYQGEERVIGYLPQKPVHHPGDEFFYLEVNEPLTSQTAVYLEYDLYGVEDNTQVSRSINDQPVFGGYVVKQHNSWSKQSEMLNPGLLKQGINTIRFSIGENATYSYKIKNLRLRIVEAGTPDKNPSKTIVVKGKGNNELRIEGEELEETSRRLIVNQPTTAYYYRRFGYIQGFVTGLDCDKALIRIGGQKVRAYRGEFESLVSRNSQGQEEEADNDVLPSHAPWNTTIEAIFPDGEILKVDITFEKPAVWDHLTGFDPVIHFTEEEVMQNESFELMLATATLQGEAGSLQKNTTLSITALRAIDLPRLNPGMVNVTAGYDGYRFLPHGSNFDKPLNITLGYDSTKLPRGHYPQEIRTYYYDESRSHWVALPRDSVNRENHLVCSRSTHFTDMINAIVKVPEMPETQEYTPTSLKELQAADPSSGIQMMQPPIANSQGTASLSYPINVPAGRQGLQPNLAVTYSSEAANSLLGMGWDMQIPAITVDNKWGVPRYDDGYETETYLYNGEELLPSARLESSWEARDPSKNEKQFYPRVESGFEKIMRKGNSPKAYYWIVTDKQGTQYYYGTYSGNTCDTSVLLKDKNGNIAHWPLCKVIDINGNYMQYCYTIRYQRSQYQARYSYTSPADTAPSVYLGQQLWLDAINYTGHGEEAGAYKVVFSSKNCSVDAARGIGCDVPENNIASSVLGSVGTQADGLSQKTNSALASGRGLPDDIVWEEVEEANDDDPPGTDPPCNNGNIPIQVCVESPCRDINLSGAVFGLGTEEPKFRIKETSPFPVTFDFSGNPSYTKITSTSTGCVNFMVCPNKTYYLVAIPPQICSKDPVSFSFRVNDLGVVSVNHENGIPMIGAHTVVISNTSNGGISFKIPVECDCSISTDRAYCYDCWEACAPYCPPQCRRKVYIGVQDDFCVNGRLPKCRFDLVCDSDPYQTVYHYTTGYTKIQPLNVRCDRWYRVTGTYFGANYQDNPIRFRFKIDSYGDVQIDDIKGVPSSISPQIIENNYNNGSVIELLMPVIPKPKQTRIQIVNSSGQGVAGYTFLLGNAGGNEGIIGVYTTDAQGYTPILPLQNGVTYYIGETDITAYNGSIAGATPYSDYIAGWPNKIELYLKKDNCVLRIGRVSGFPVPDISCSSGTCTFVYQEPERILSKEIRIKKTASDEELIAGAVFRLNNATDYTTGENGLTSPITITYGQTYVLQERSVPAGFLLDERKIYISMNHAGVVGVNSQIGFDFDPASGILTLTNQRGCEGTSFMVRKQDAATGEALSGALIKYYKNNDRNNALDRSVTDSLGHTHEMAMECDQTYYIREAAVPSGYKSDHPAFAVVTTHADGSITVLDSAQLHARTKVDGVWVFTFVNHKDDESIDSIRPVVGCSSTYAYDNTINARNGFRQSSKEKLSKIVVFYKDSCVRTYTFCYTMDFYGRALLEEISQWGSEDTLEAYTHSFTYYNDAGDHRNLFQGPETITVSNNEEDSDGSKRIAKKLRNFFMRGFVSPSILGGSRTWSTGINTGGDIGLFPAFPLKTLSAGLYGNGGISSSKGKTTMIDVNGDGLPDRVYNVMEGIRNKTYYCLQKPNREGFEGSRPLNGIGVFLQDFSDNASAGLQASAFIHGGIQKGFLGNTWTDVYIADMSGDGFMEVVSPKGVKSIGKHQQPPRFTFGDCLLPEITTAIDSIEVQCDTSFSFTPEVYERDRTKELRYDLVRVWQADMDCNYLPDLTYGICAPVHLAYDSIALENFCGNPDSVIVSIEYYGKGLTGNMEHILLWSDVIGDSDTTNHGPNFCDLVIDPEPDPEACPVMLRKTDHRGRPLGNVVFKLKDGTELVTDASKGGRTPAFYLRETGSCIEVTEMTPLPHCFPFQQPFTICREEGGAEDGTDCNITLQGPGFISKEKIGKREVHVITLTNDCNEKPQCFVRVLKTDQHGNPLEGVEFKVDNGIKPGLSLTTNTQGLTPLINVFAGECSVIEEITPLSYCDSLSVRVKICADNACNIPVPEPFLVSPDEILLEEPLPSLVPSQQINGMLIHTITIPNNCNTRGITGSMSSDIKASQVLEDESAAKAAWVNGNYDLSALKLCKGDKLFFRVRPQDNGVKKKVVWDPVILPYSGSLSRTDYLDENGRIYGGGDNASKSQLLQGDSAFPCPAKGRITIESVINPLSVPLTDDIQFEIWANDNRLYRAIQRTKVQTYTTSLDVDTNVRLKFKIVCKSNVNMHEIQWYPKVYYNYLNYGNKIISTIVEDDNGDNVRMMEYIIAPYHDFYHKTAERSSIYINKIYDIPHTSRLVTRRLSQLYIPSGKAGKAYITIKQDGILCFSKEVSFSQGSPPISFFPGIDIPLLDDPGKPVYISCYVEDPEVADKILNCDLVIDGNTYYATVYTKHPRDVLFGELYGGWGQFLYQTDSIPDKNPLSLMRMDKIKFLSTLTQSNITQYVDTSRLGGDSIRHLRTFAKSEEYDRRLAEVKDALFCLPMFNEPEYRGHVGYYPNAFIRGADMNIGGLPCPEYEDESEPCEDGDTNATSNANPNYEASLRGTKQSLSEQVNEWTGEQVNEETSGQADGNMLVNPVITRSEERATRQPSLRARQSQSPDSGITNGGDSLATPNLLGFVPRNSAPNQLSGSNGGTGGLAGINILAGMDAKKTSSSENTSYTAGVSIPGLSIGNNESSTTTTQDNDLMDLNGDGFPDIIRKDRDKTRKVYYSFPQAALWEPEAKDPFNGETHHKVEVTGYGSNYTADPVGFITAAKNSNKGQSVPTKSQKDPPVSITASKSETRSEDRTLYTLLDINGDGLPDRVYNVGKNVALNLGYGFESAERWNLKEIGLSVSNAYSHSFSAGGSGGSFPFNEFSGGSKSYSGGTNGTKAYSQAKEMLADINGDGLPDKVVIAGEKTLHIHYNTGCGYNKYADVITLGVDDPALYEWNTTKSKGANFGLTLGFPIVWWAKISLSGGADASFSLSTTSIQFMDMDGDGYADLVMAPDENSLIVRYSNLGRTGLLKSIKNPLGGSMELAYHKTEANVFHSRRWVMDTVKIRDNFPGDGAGVMMTTYRYDTGYYDRRERVFYGFAKVTENHHDTENGNTISRKYLRYYYNNNFYYKGLNLTEAIQNGGDSLYILTMNRYNNHALTRDGIGSMYATLDTTVTCYFEGQADAPVRQQKTWQYETTYGNVIRQTETSTGMPLITMDITYHPDPGNYRVSIPGNVEIAGYRKRTTAVDNKGRMTQIRDYYDDNNSLVTKMTYGDYGNCTKIEYPGNSYFEYEYDNEVYSYPVKITNAFNHSSFVEEYDFRFGVPLTVKDKSGHFMFYTLDQFGRTTEICAPKEQLNFIAIALDTAMVTAYSGDTNIATGIPIQLGDFTLGGLQLSSLEIIPIKQHYTVKYVYRRGNVKDSIPFSAITFNYDPAHPGGNIRTYTFSDGLGRIIQTKKDAEVNGEAALVVSGKVEYDAFGRTVKTGYPTVEMKQTPVVVGDPMAKPVMITGNTIAIAVIQPQGNLIMVPVEWDGIIPPSASTYDILDRPLEQKAPDNTKVSYSYGFGIDQHQNKTLFKTEVTDQNTNISVSLSNVSKQQYEVIPAGHQPVWFHYNDIGDLLKVEGVDFERSYLYDMLGRKTQYQEDSLKEEYVYDEMNLTEKKSYWNESGTAQDKTIYYMYNRNRLEAVHNPDYIENIVYTYSNNNGKLLSIWDASGTQRFEYGSMGEVTKQTRVYSLPFMEQTVKLETRFEYDSWGRTLNMTYPDGEKVTYEYDYGGQLKKMQGVKDTSHYNYLENIEYDKFGAKTRVEYGNNMTTKYSYNPLNLRLTNQNLSIKRTSGQLFWLEDYLNTSYMYDPKGNITGINTSNYKLNEFSVNETFTYDVADQLDSASGNDGNVYTVKMSYGNYGRINTNNTSYTDPQINGNTQYISTSYAYQTQNAPSNNFAPISANNGDITFGYGINGSMRKRTAPDKTEYYLYNTYEQMKVYSDNKQTYGYYNYDDAGQRMYKATLNNTIARTNALEGNVLEVEKLMLYPNGYININQDGNYTKHYYAEDARIASKIGTGFSDSISGVTVGNTFIYNTMVDELGLATNDTIDNIVYSFGQIRYLRGDSNKYENGLYFYHGNHLSSTQLITNIHGELSQAMLYSPWGVILSEYRADWMLDTIPRYLWNGKERDEESNLDYFEARYYSSDAVTFQSRDPKFEEYFWLSPYCAFGNNPVKYIDPTGMDIEVDMEGQTYTYKNVDGVYGFYNKEDGALYTGDNKFLNNLSTDLGKLVSGNRGKELVDGLIDSDNTVKIGPTGSRGSFADTDNNIVGLYKNEKAMEQTGYNTMESFIVLAHELAHIEDKWCGTYDNSEWIPGGAVKLNDGKTYNIDRTYISKSEKYATSIENAIRAEHKLPLRTHYSTINVGGAYPGNNNGWIGDERTRIAPNK